MKIKILNVMPAALIAIAIALSPSFSAGVIESGRMLEIKVEDILIIILGAIFVFNILLLKKTNIQKPPLFIPITAWIAISLFSILLNLILKNITASNGLFFFVKEVEFFIIYFLVFYSIKSLSGAKSIIKLLVFLGVINAGWIIFQIVTSLRLTYYYGPTSFIEPDSPFISGGFFLLFFIFLSNLFLFYYRHLKISNFKKISIGLLCFFPIVGVLSSGSRTTLFSLIPSIILIFIFYLFKENYIKKLFSFILFFIFTIIITVSIILPTIPGSYRILDTENIVNELNIQNTNKSSRVNIWKNQIIRLTEKPLYLTFGFGKSFLLDNQQPHNQYLQNIVDTGIIGFIAFLVILYLIIKISLKNFLEGKDAFIVGISAALVSITFSMLIMSFAAEAFRVVKISELYWFLVALSMASIVLHKQHIIHKSSK